MMANGHNKTVRDLAAAQTDHFSFVVSSFLLLQFEVSVAFAVILVGVTIEDFFI